jgi:hypothetical protein
MELVRAPVRARDGLLQATSAAHSRFLFGHSHSLFCLKNSGGESNPIRGRSDLAER